MFAKSILLIKDKSQTISAAVFFFLEKFLETFVNYNQFVIKIKY